MGNAVVWNKAHGSREHGFTYNRALAHGKMRAGRTGKSYYAVFVPFGQGSRTVSNCQHHHLRVEANRCIGKTYWWWWQKTRECYHQNAKAGSLRLFRHAAKCGRVAATFIIKTRYRPASHGSWGETNYRKAKSEFSLNLWSKGWMKTRGRRSWKRRQYYAYMAFVYK